MMWSPCGRVSGKLNVKDKELEDMLKEATGPINFTMFLNLFGEKLHGENIKEPTQLYTLRLIHWTERLAQMSGVKKVKVHAGKCRSDAVF